MNLSWQHLLAFLFAVGLLVTVHEFGHYWVARRLGFKVLKFSVGFGKALWKRTGKDADQVEYAISAIPLGGYVKLLDEREGNVDPAEAHRAFNRRPHWQRILVLLAGPFFNIAFAVLLLAAMFAINGRSELRAVVGAVTVDSPAALAGLKSGDEILAIDDSKLPGQADVMLALLDHMSDDGRASLTVKEKNGRERTVALQISDAAARRELTQPDRLLAGLGFDFWRPEVPAELGEVVSGGAAAQAGLQQGDVIVSIDGQRIANFEQIRELISPRAGQVVAVQFKRGSTELRASLTVGSDVEAGKTVGRIGVGSARSVKYPPDMLTTQSVSIPAALWMGTREAWKMTALQARVFWRMIKGQVSLKNLSGPLTIAEVAGDSAKSGLGSFVGFLVLISLSLGFLNLLPIPMLDGGQIVYQTLEWIKGSPLSDRFMIWGQQLGIALLVLLMGVALYNDVLRQFG